MNRLMVTFIILIMLVPYVYAEESSTPTSVFVSLTRSLQNQSWSDAFSLLEKESREKLCVVIGQRAQTAKMFFDIGLGEKGAAEAVSSAFEKQKGKKASAEIFFSDIMEYQRKYTGFDPVLDVLRFPETIKLPGNRHFAFSLRELKIIGPNATATVFAVYDATGQKRSVPIKFVNIQDVWKIKLDFPETKETKESISGGASTQVKTVMDSGCKDSNSLPQSWPSCSEELTGPNIVRVKNPNSFHVCVGLRSYGKGNDFTVTQNGIGSTSVPDGEYSVYFWYSSDPESIYQGDIFLLVKNGIEIQIKKVVDGNYGIRKIK